MTRFRPFALLALFLGLATLAAAPPLASRRVALRHPARHAPAPVLQLVPTTRLVCDAPWTGPALAAAWANVYDAQRDARLPAPLVPDGVRDNLAGINADMAYIAGHGGGVLLLRAGVYKINTVGVANINMASGVFVEGEGEGVTVLAFNSAGTHFSGGVYWYNTANTGLCQLSLRNDAPTEILPPDPNQATQNATTLGTNKNILLKRVAWDLGYGNRLMFYGCKNIALEDSTIDAHLSDYGSLGISGCDGVTEHRVYLRYKVQRPLTLGCRDVDVSGVQWLRDGAAVSTHAPGAGVESGGPEFSYCQGLVIKDCSEAVTGPTDQNLGAGEALLSQDDGGSPIYHFGDVGRLSSVSGTTMADTSKSWPASWRGLAGCPNIPFVVGITEKRSPALGQYRTVVSHTATAVTFDAPFSPAPNPGDHYFVGMWCLLDARITGCSFANNTNPVELASGGCDIEIDHCSVLDSGGVSCFGFSHTVLGAGRLFPLWGVRVHDDYIANPNAQQLSAVAFTAAVADTVYPGSLVVSVSAYANTIVPQPLGAAWTNKFHGRPSNGSSDPNGRDGIYLNVTGGGLATAALRAQTLAGVNVLRGLNNGLGKFDAAQAAKPPSP